MVILQLDVDADLFLAHSLKLAAGQLLLAASALLVLLTHTEVKTGERTSQPLRSILQTGHVPTVVLAISIPCHLARTTTSLPMLMLLDSSSTPPLQQAT